MTHDDPSDQLGLLADALCEHNDDASPPEDWPDWTDDDRVALGGPACRAESLFDEEPAPDPLPLTDETDIALLQKLDTTPWQRWLAEPGDLES
jgi:hypothetical protein